MSQLTITAKKIYAGLFCGNLLIILAIMLLGQYFYYVNVKPIVPPQTVRALGKMVRYLKENPEANWSKLSNRQNLPWSKLTLSHSPLYEDNALLNFQPAIIFDLLKQNKKLQVSILLKNENWLNVSMMPPVPDPWGLWLTVTSLLFVLLIALILINYWAVKALNQPIQTLIQSLNYSDEKANWLPIPLTGNPDQRLIFEKINSLQERLSHLLENRTRVVTAISHDLRTPLTRLKLRAEYLAADPQFDKIMQDINEMEMMIRETLDYFKEVNSEEKSQRFDLVALMHSLVEDAKDLNYDVSFAADRDKLIYIGQVNLLKRALSNLINNAVHYGKNASINLRQFTDKIEISIEDSGPGLDADDLERVFMPFYRTEQSRSRETGGTGLGLTIAREIIQKHYGEITLSNRAEGGLRVVVVFNNKP